MDERLRILAAVVATIGLFLAVQLGALALVEPFHEGDRQAVEDPGDPTNSLVYVGVILVATAFMLAAFRYDLAWLIRALVVAVSVLLAWFVLAELVPPVLVGPVNPLALGGALAVGAGLLVHPEWYVIDAAGVVMGAGAAGLFGISFGLLPAIVFLAILAVYDAISVYRTGHMLDLAEGVMDLKIPVVLVVPTTLSYSHLATGSAEGVIEGGGESDSDDGRDAGLENGGRSGDDAAPEGDPLQRDALYIGLGDAVIPTILVASAVTFLETDPIAVPGIALTVPALGAILGTLVGLVALLALVLRGRPHAGLPLLNGGAIGGYLLGAVASGVSITTALGL